MKKKKNKITLTTFKILTLTFIVSSIIISIIYILNDVTPFGGKSLLDVDFFHQYGPMLGELYDRIHNFSSLTYSFSMGMGLPIFRNFLNYLSSPFNIVLLFFKKEHLLTAFSVIIGLKAVASSMTMVYYLNKKYKKISLSLIPFGVIYAFSAYFSAYHWNIMWLDGMVFLPLITLEIEKMVDKGQWKLYTIYLAMMLFTNYYIGYMICFFSVIYFIAYNVNKYSFKKEKIKETIKQIFKNGLKFFYASLLAGGLIAILMIPLYHSLTSISATGGNIPKSQYYLFQFSDFLKYHFSGVANTVFASNEITAPNISCGILSLSLLLIFIFNIELPIKKKICYLFLLTFFVIAFFYAPLDFILQGFHVPNDLPYRYSFIYSFVIVAISFYSFKNLDKINYRMSILIYFIISLSLFIISSSDWPGINTNMIYNNLILLSIYFILYTIYRTRKIPLAIIYIAMIILTSCDAVLSIDNNWQITHVVENYYHDYEKIENNLNYISKNDSELFYRIEKNNYMTLSDSSWYGYYGITGFSSMSYESMAKLQHYLGIKGNFINSYEYRTQTPIYDMMFDIKYILDNPDDNSHYKALENNDIYQFKYNLGLAYGISKNISSWENSYQNPFEMQNKYLEYSTGIKNTLKPIFFINKRIFSKTDNKTIVKYTYQNPNSNVYFYTEDYNFNFAIIDQNLYYKNNDYESLNNIINNIYINLYDYEEPYIINIYPKSDNDTIDIYIAYNNYNGNDMYLYVLDEKKFIAAYDKLKNNRLNITSFKENKIEGNIILDDDMVVYTSIPYDEGWHVLVDNKEVKTFSIADALLSLETTKGTHEIVIYYRIKGFGIGLVISLISLAIIVLDTLYSKKKIIKKHVKASVK